MFEFEQKEHYTLEEVQELVEGFKVKHNQLITTKDTELEEVKVQLDGFEDLKKSNHELTIKSLMVADGLEDGLFDLVYDEDLELVKNKIILLKDKVTSKQDNNYIPTKVKKEDDYNKAIKSGDVEGALRNKLGRLFA